MASVSVPLPVHGTPLNILKSASPFFSNRRNSFTEPDNGTDWKNETVRLRSFAGWPCTHIITPESLAKAGFYYTKQEDRVKCAFCGVVIGRWEAGDDAVVDHKKWSPSCLFINHVVSNTPESDSLGHDVCGNNEFNVRSISVPENCTCPSQMALRTLRTPKQFGPRYREFALFDSRLITFAEWPISIKQKPKDLADAGFFYTGKADQTICFCCGLGLSKWEEHDDVWEQHALWSGDCNYLLLKKSPEFVQQVRDKKKGQGEMIGSEIPAQEAERERNATNEESKPEADDAVQNNNLCRICFVKEVGVFFVPCGHVVACVDCAPALRNCVMCRKPLQATYRAFVS